MNKALKNKKILIIATASIVVMILTVVAFAVQNKSGQKNDQNTDPPTEQTSDEATAVLKRDNVNIPVNRRAQQVESEAASLIETAPLEASKKYQEAAKIYTEAGNHNKAADMTDNAKSVESLAPVEQPKPSDPLITPQSPVKEG